jgi:hypothetical protein
MSIVRTTEQDNRVVQAPAVARPRVSEQTGDDVDRASRDSFPASDPPSWNGVRLGSPRHAADSAEDAEEDAEDRDR